MVKGIRVIAGDSLDVMRQFPDDSYDACITDPPYGLRFMGKTWDHGVPGELYWKEVLRVIKPGAHVLAFGGTRTHHRLMVAIEDAGLEICDCLMWLYGTGKPASKNRLKPAWEPIIAAHKPGAHTMNIEACRLEPLTDKEVQRSGASTNGKVYGKYGSVDWKRSGMKHPGRWPSNLLLDEESADMLDDQTGDRPNGYRKNPSKTRESGRIAYGNFEDGHVRGERGYADAGGASRFFYCAKASNKERGEGNTHPTVKPRKLMAWLIRLVTPAGGSVLDPFSGSGSTLLACIDEGMRGTGIDNDPSSVRIALTRIKAEA